MPRRESPDHFRLCHRCGLCPEELIGPKAAPNGVARPKQAPCMAGHSRRLTASDKAVAELTTDPAVAELRTDFSAQAVTPAKPRNAQA